MIIMIVRLDTGLGLKCLLNVQCFNLDISINKYINFCLIIYVNLCQQDNFLSYYSFIKFKIFDFLANKN